MFQLKRPANAWMMDLIRITLEADVKQVGVRVFVWSFDSCVSLVLLLLDWFLYLLIYELELSLTFLTAIYASRFAVFSHLFCGVMELK